MFTVGKREFDRAIPTWIILGQDGRGNVDIEDNDGVIFSGLPLELAEKALALRERHISEMAALLNARL